MANIKLDVNDAKIDKKSNHLNFNKNLNVHSKLTEILVIQLMVELSKKIGYNKLKEILERWNKIMQVDNMTKQ